MGPEIAAIAGVIGTGVSALGQLSAGAAAKSQANYQAQIAENNKQIAERRAEAARQAGAVQAEAAGRRARAQQGSVTAALAASGVDVNTGSAEDIRRSTAETGVFNQAAAEHNALLQAYGYQGSAMGFEAEAALDRAAASRAMPAALLGAGGTLFSSASQLPLKFRWMAEPSGSGSPRSAAAF